MPQQFVPRTQIHSEPSPAGPSLQIRKHLSADGDNSNFDIHRTNWLGLQSLISLYDQEEKLFSESLTTTEVGYSRTKTSRTGTMIAMLGLQQLSDADSATPFDLAAIGEAVLGDLRWVESVGELGLLIWAVSVCMPERLETVLQRFDFDAVIECYPDARRCETTGLAFLLAGLSHLRLVCPRLTQGLTDLAAESYHRLLENAGESGLFRHAAVPSLGHGFLRRRYGTAADQMCAVYALTTFSRAFELDEPLEAALNCANAICALQGDKGQWWFLYDTKEGRVARKYPVYSIHQDGVSPIALRTLGRSTGRSFDAAISKGLSWLAAQNELGTDLRDWGNRLIWDSIGCRGRITECWNTLRGYLRFSPNVAPRKLKVHREARSEHFGWLLFAFGKMGLSPTVAPAGEVGGALEIRLES